MGGVALEVRQALATRVGGGDTCIRTIARTLATSPRALQRRLADAGVSYQQLLDLARRDAAERYLTESPLSISEVAYATGLPPSNGTVPVDARAWRETLLTFE